VTNAGWSSGIRRLAEGMSSFLPITLVGCLVLLVGLKKLYPWAEINNMLIKDDYITIDFKNNKLIQKQINEPVTETIKNEFNAFCAEHLAKTR
jgi:hypothetical protein